MPSCMTSRKILSSFILMFCATVNLTAPPGLIAETSRPADVLSNSIVFGAQADLHSFNRIPRPYMMKVLADLPKVHADFFAVLGDLVARKTGIDIARNSPVPVYFVYGDHEHFEEWGYIRQQGVVPELGRSGWPRHEGGVFNAMCSDMPMTEAWTGLPYFWSLNYKGIHFVFAYSGKNVTTPAWFLQWLKRDLQDNRNLTTVVLTHRGLLEFGERWNLPKQWDTIIKGAPQVKLIVYGHYHYPNPIEMLGKEATTVDVELTRDFPGRKGESFEGGFYGLFSIAADGIRIWARYPETGNEVPLLERKIRTTYRRDAESSVSLPYLVSESSKHYLPALKLEDAKLRLWGVETEQLVPNSLLAPGKKVPWRALGQVEIKPADAPEKHAGKALSRMLGVHIREADGSPEAPARLARLDIGDIRFDQKAISELMVSGENVYSALLLVRAPKGRNVWFIMDTLKGVFADRPAGPAGLNAGHAGLPIGKNIPKGEVEASYITKVKSTDPDRLHYIFQQVYDVYIRGQKIWQWSPGPKGQEDKDIVQNLAAPRQANKLALYLATPDKVENETWQIALFVYLTDAPYAPAPQGRTGTQNLAVSVGERKFKAKELPEGTPQEFPLGNLVGGTPFSVADCEGSRLALVDFTGRLAGLMQFNLRQIKETSPRTFLVGDSCGGEANPATEGLSILTALRPMSVNRKPTASNKSCRLEIEDGAALAVPREKAPE